MPAAAANARAPLDRSAIVAAALDLLQAEGLDQVSTRKLAKAVGVSGPSLYWHFKSMADIRSLMAEALLKAAIAKTRPTDDWRSWLAEGARTIRRAALSHRDGARLLASAPASPDIQGRGLANMDRLVAAGFSKREARYAFMALHRYALGTALAEQASDPPAPSDTAFEYGLTAMVGAIQPTVAKG